MRSSGIQIFERVLRAPKRHRDGTHRTCTPEETLARWRPAMARFGITRLADLTGLDDLGVPVVSAIRPNGRSLATQQGKGTTRAAATASALMESIETWHAEHVVLPVRRATVRALGATDAIADVDGLPRRRAVARTRPLDWIAGWDLVTSAPRWLPREAVSLDCTFDRARPPVFDVSSNGLASGNHLLEAIVHGLCEVIERDAEAQWRAEGGQRRLVLDTITVPAVQRLLAKLRAGGARVAIWDITSDVGVPAYGAGLMEDPEAPSWRGLGVYQGFGCHLDPAIAVLRALTEAAQTRLTYIAGSRDDFFPFDYAAASDPDRVAGAWAAMTSPPDEAVDFAAAPRLATPTFEGDLARVCERLVATGTEQILIADLSRPDIGVPVVKTLVPGRATALEWMG